MTLSDLIKLSNSELALKEFFAALPLGENWNAYKGWISEACGLTGEWFIAANGFLLPNIEAKIVEREKWQQCYRSLNRQLPVPSA
jgi:hypothetical protein